MGRKNKSPDRLNMRYVKKVAERFLEPGELEQFSRVVESGFDFGTCIIWLAEQQQIFESLPALSWQCEWMERLKTTESPGKNPLHDEGAYYCVDASSAFAISILGSILKKPCRILDVCASPGGKAIMASRMFSGVPLVANEVMKNRLPQLCINLERCHIQPATVIWSSVEYLAEHAASTADLVLLDVPCSGQSLLSRGQKNPGAFNPRVIAMNERRQRFILRNAATTVVPGGYLCYMTCTYSYEENEKVINWFMEEFKDFIAVPSEAHSDYRSEIVDFPCYRMWPQQGIGAGSFMCLLKREGEAEPASINFDPLRVQWCRE